MPGSPSNMIHRPIYDLIVYAGYVALLSVGTWMLMKS